MLQLYMMEKRTPFYLLGYILIIAALLGRTICGWLCPFGFFVDIIDKLAKGDWRPKWYGWHYVKYGMLAGAAVGAFLFVDIVFCKYFCFTGLIFGITPYWVTWHTVTLYWFTYHIILLIIFIYMSYRAGGRAWCRYLCPFGAFLSLFNSISFIQLKFDKSACTDCGRCAKVCPMDIEPTRFSLHDKLGCTRCGTCLNVCPTDALRIGGVNLLPTGIQLRKLELGTRNPPCVDPEKTET
ncbi:MAG: 4Fe-4S binding protein [Candidatus Hodarchaeota archaeon]